MCGWKETCLQGWCLPMYHGGMFGLIRVKPESKTTCKDTNRCEGVDSHCTCMHPRLLPTAAYRAKNAALMSGGY